MSSDSEMDAVVPSSSAGPDPSTNAGPDPSTNAGPDPPSTSGASKPGNKKRLSVERIYQKKTPLEHILLRPDTYIGSIEKVTQPMWVMDQEKDLMVQRDVTFCPGLYKIFDEILVNAADNKIRDPSMNCIKIDIKQDDNMIRIWNNGKGIPVVQHKVEKVFVPTMIFGHLLTSSNYDDTERKVTGGRNGYGAKLCNIFSKKFIVETSCRESRKSFKQTWIDNMTKTSDPKISAEEESDFTSVTFYPDLARFGMTHLEQDTVDLFTRRAYDMAASTRGVKVFLNGKRVPVTSFKDYVGLYLKNQADEAENPIKIVYENSSPRWEIALAPSLTGFQQVSFVNSIATTKGGRHVDYIVEQVTNKLLDVVKKKAGKSGVQVKAFQVKNHMWLFINCLIENPAFDSQTKEFMTLQQKSFGSTCTLSEKFVQQVSKCGIVDLILSWIKFKAMEKMDKQCHAKKHSKLKGIPKLEDANEAGTKNSNRCTLVLTEGDSAKTLAVAGLGVVGRDHFGVFPLRGKVLNVREASSKQIMENVEINALIKIVGLQYKHKYDNPESIQSLRYGKIMIMTDQDQDGSHIKGLLINFFHCNWPNLIRHNFLEEFITPIVKAFKGKQEIAFYSLPEFEEWTKGMPNWQSWRVKYYKGLGTSSSKEAKEYFSDMTRHRIRFRYSGQEDDAGICLAFAKTKVDERKEWLTRWMEDRKRRIELGLPELYLYGKDTKAITYSDFINQELILFSCMDNERSIPSLVDGFKPGQRKVLFTCLKRNLVKEIKVAQLAGSVSELSSYHHGEVSLMSTIVGLAQDFVGSNNLNLLLPNGQFGTRLTGGKDSASPRYIFTALSPLTRLIFHPYDEPILKFLFEDNQRIEPEWYVPILPMVLINGSDGIGTGWMTRIPNFNVMEIVTNLRRMLNGADPQPMLPSYRGFTGVIQELDANRYMVHGETAVLDEETIEITELPVGTWTQTYKETVLEPMLNGTEKVPACVQDYKEYHTDTTVRFVVKMTANKLQEAEAKGLHKYFKLSTPLTTNSMVLFDHMGCIRRYNSVLDILREFFDLRMSWYDKRKSYLEGMLSAEARKLENQARFILEHIRRQLIIDDMKTKDIIQLLITNNYESDPVKAFRECLNKLAALEEERENVTEEGGTDEGEEKTGSGADFNYLLNMPMRSLTREKKEELLRQRDEKQKEFQAIKCKTSRDLWLDDLTKFEQETEKFEQQRKADEAEEIRQKAAADSQKKGGRGKARPHVAKETLPDPLGRRIVPRIDEEVVKKVEAAKKKKAKADGEAGQKKLDDFFAANDIFGNDEDEPKPLAERLSEAGVKISPVLKPQKRGVHFITTNSGERGSAGSGAGRGRGAKKKNKGSEPMDEDAPGPSNLRGTKKTSDSPKKRGGRSSSGGSPKKSKGKKRQPWESDNSEEEGDLSDSGSGDEPSDEIAPLRDRLPRRGATSKAKYVYDDEEEERGSEDDVGEQFRAVDHGQGGRDIEVEPPTRQVARSSSRSSVSSVEGDVKEKTAPAPAPAADVGGPKKQRKLAPTSSTMGATSGASKKRVAGGGNKKSGAVAKKTNKESEKGGAQKNLLNDWLTSAPPPREKTQRRQAAGKAKYVFDDDEEEEANGSEFNIDDASNDDDFKARKKPPVKRISHSADSESDEDFAPQVARKKRAAGSDSDEDFAPKVKRKH